MGNRKISWRRCYIQHRTEQFYGAGIADIRNAIRQPSVKRWICSKCESKYRSDEPRYCPKCGDRWNQKENK